MERAIRPDLFTPASLLRFGFGNVIVVQCSLWREAQNEVKGSGDGVMGGGDTLIGADFSHIKRRN